MWWMPWAFGLNSLFLAVGGYRYREWLSGSSDDDDDDLKHQMLAWIFFGSFVAWVSCILGAVFDWGDQLTKAHWRSEMLMFSWTVGAFGPLFLVGAVAYAAGVRNGYKQSQIDSEYTDRPWN